MTAYPLLPVRDLAVFPGMRLPLYVARPLSIGAISHALAHDLPLLVVAQRQGATEHPQASDLYAVGALVKVLNCLSLVDGSRKIEVLAQERVRLLGVEQLADRIEGRADILAELPGDGLTQALESLVLTFGRLITPAPKPKDAIVATMQAVLEGPAENMADRIDRLRAALEATAA